MSDYQKLEVTLLRATFYDPETQYIENTIFTFGKKQLCANQAFPVPQATGPLAALQEIGEGWGLQRRQVGAYLLPTQWDAGMHSLMTHPSGQEPGQEFGPVPQDPNHAGESLLGKAKLFTAKRAQLAPPPRLS